VLKLKTQQQLISHEMMIFLQDKQNVFLVLLIFLHRLL